MVQHHNNTTLQFNECVSWCLYTSIKHQWQYRKLREMTLLLTGSRRQQVPPTTGTSLPQDHHLNRLTNYMKNSEVYTGCPRRNVQYFGRVFLMLNYTDITQNTYIQSWTVTEIMAREKCGFLGCPRTVRRPWRHTHALRMPGNILCSCLSSVPTGHSKSMHRNRPRQFPLVLPGPSKEIARSKHRQQSNHCGSHKWRQSVNPQCICYTSQLRVSAISIQPSSGCVHNYKQIFT